MVGARKMPGLVAAVLVLGALACSVSLDSGRGRLRQRHHRLRRGDRVRADGG